MQQKDAGVGNQEGDDLRICKSQIKIKEKLGICVLCIEFQVRPNLLHSREIQLIAMRNKTAQHVFYNESRAQSDKLDNFNCT